MLKGLYGPVIFATFRRRQVDQIGRMRAGGHHPTLLSCNIELFNIGGRQPSFLPGAGILCEYLQSSTSVFGCSKHGLMQPACNGKMGAKEDHLLFVIPSFICGSNTLAFLAKKGIVGHYFDLMEEIKPTWKTKNR